MSRNTNNDLYQVFKTLQLLAQSQIGYEGRLAQSKARKELLRTVVNGGKVIKPFDVPLPKPDTTST